MEHLSEICQNRVWIIELWTKTFGLFCEVTATFESKCSSKMCWNSLKAPLRHHVHQNGTYGQPETSCLWLCPFWSSGLKSTTKTLNLSTPSLCLIGTNCPLEATKSQDRKDDVLVRRSRKEIRAKRGREQKHTKEKFVDRFFDKIAISREAPEAKCFFKGRKATKVQVWGTSRDSEGQDYQTEDTTPVG